jgi:TolB protein
LESAFAASIAACMLAGVGTLAPVDASVIVVMSAGSQDESPSFAPNSDTLIYATRVARNGVLETVTADGLIRQRVSSGQGDVREPVWSPFPRY